MDNLNNTLNVTKDNYINLIAYEEDAFKKIFPKSIKEDYIKTQFVVDYPYEAIIHFEEKYNRTFNGSRFIIIDDEYISWCKNNNNQINTQSLNEYTSSMSDKTAERLWVKNGRHYDLVLCSIPIIIKYCYEQTKYSRYCNFSYETLLNTKRLLSDTFKINEDDIFIFKDALIKDDALINSPIIEEYFKDSIENKATSPKFIKSIFKGHEEDSFTIKYIICGIKINRKYKMNKELALEDCKIDIGKILVNDEMANLSEILSEENPNLIIYPAFDRLINIREIESSDEILKNFLPNLTY